MKYNDRPSTRVIQELGTKIVVLQVARFTSLIVRDLKLSLLRKFVIESTGL